MTAETQGHDRESPPVWITISAEHRGSVEDVASCFDGKFPVDACLMRNSYGDLPMQIMLWIGSAVASGIAWDLIKSGITKIWEKFSNARVTVRYEGIMFCINKDGSVRSIVAPEREREFQHISNLDQLIQCLQWCQVWQNSDPINDGTRTTLGSVVEYLGRGVTPKYATSWIRVFNQKCIRNGDILEQDSRFLDTDQAIPQEKILQNGDILVCSTGIWTLWRVWQLKTATERSTADSHVTIVRINKENSKIYFWYLLKSKEQLIESLAEWSTWQTELPREKLRWIAIRVPPLCEQESVAQILSSLDRKIELLRSQCETLEKTAYTIFQNWFTDYAPFKKDLIEGESGSYIGGDKNTRLIPRWWKIGKLGDIAEITSWKRPTEMGNDKKGVFQYPLIGATKIMGYVPDYLFEWETLVIGRVWTHGEIQRFDEKIYPSDNTLVIKSRFFIFTYFILKEIDYQKLNRWAVQPLITQTDLKNQMIIIPSETVMNSFITTTNPIYEKMSLNLKQIRKLENIRNLTLPKLMDGSLRAEYI